MSITLITAVPGAGKTIYAVWNILKPAVEAGRTIYTAAIPELKLPTIRKGYKDIRKWHEREYIEIANEYQQDLPEDEIPSKLLNFQEGSLIVIDEVQNLWPSGGSKEPSEDITYLTKHRHHGLEIVLITQAPQLVHQKVLAVVDKHLHIRKSWFGRQIFEWPEYCSTTRAVSSRMSAVRNNYKLPKQAYGLYRSASMHVTQKMTVPIFAYLIPLIIVFVGYFAYKSYHSVMDRAKPNQETTLIAEEKALEKTLTPEKAPQTPQPAQPVHVPQPVRTINYVVSDQVDWSKVGGCLSNETQCICYGHNAERLVVPNETCRIGAKHGWPGKQS
ncbi:zonular occludens toxin family protein [Nitrosomonas sp. Nm166]|uniref:zonular occludens toxin family protein n=1 Tax=Nitrosomonas sp. Nm166 TaxID=1881054 RepID=UPI0008EF4B7E|nr:zonular occludens toxin domain-containing protein [Nitrosomonas sp. Nm166]SFF12783.1 zona occludens toxin [Nitrosomonas sp. Nm166]